MAHCRQRCADNRISRTGKVVIPQADVRYRSRAAVEQDAIGSAGYDISVKDRAIKRATSERIKHDTVVTACKYVLCGLTILHRAGGASAKNQTSGGVQHSVVISNNMAASEVALALSIPMPKNAISEGTIIIPPPIPNKPDIMPAQIPSNKNANSICVIYVLQK